MIDELSWLDSNPLVEISGSIEALARVRREKISRSNRSLENSCFK
jgi:hypothetical protein